MWISSKLTIPAPLTKSIERKGLLQELEINDQCKLILFQSPAGYGKTTIAAQWLAHYPHVGWFSIDSSDNDPVIFAHYFLAALNHATFNSCEKSQAILKENQQINLKNLFSSLLNELSNWQNLSFLVLDDYHLIQDNDIHDALRFFMHRMPANIKLVITSRTLPKIGIANLRVQCQLIEIDTASLAFTKEEAHRFLLQFNADGISLDHSADLCAQVEGWPSALQLIALNSKKAANFPKVATNQTLAHLWDYLADEVFAELDKQSREFLMQCSILDRFNHELAYEITKDQDTKIKLEAFCKQGLLICLNEANERWYRFHNLFADFLFQQRQLLMPEAEEQLLNVAVNALLKTNQPEQALACAMKAKNTELKIKVLIDQGWQLFNQGNIRLLNKALDKLKNEELFSYPPLVFLKAWLAQAQHRYNEASEQLEFAIQEMTNRNIELKNTEQGEFYALMAQVAINQNQSDRALTLSEKALENLPSNAYQPRIVATSVIGEVHHCLGQLNRALTLIKQAEKLARQYGLYQQALWALLQQAEIELARGSTSASIEKLDKAQELINRYHLEQLPLYEFMMRTRALVMWNLYRLDEAEALANHSLDVMSYYDKSRSLPAFTQLAKNALLKRDLQRSQYFLDQCEKLLIQDEYHIDWKANVNMVQLVLWQMKEDKISASMWLESAETLRAATNHFLQLQHRNLARAHYILENYDTALSILNTILALSKKLHLVTDNQYNLTLSAVILDKMGDKVQAEEQLIEAIFISTSTRIMACFYLEPITVLPILNRIYRNKELDKLVRHQVKTLIDSMSQHNTARALNFDESIVKKLLASNRLPDAIKTSPLTHREWQVMGLIYSGFSNEQISAELDVAPTTIKTHIRNLYQKLQVTNREQAINLAERLIKTINY